MCLENLCFKSPYTSLTPQCKGSIFTTVMQVSAFVVLVGLEGLIGQLIFSNLQLLFLFKQFNAFL